MVYDASNLNLSEMLRTGQQLPTAAIPSIRKRKIKLLDRAKELQRELDDTLAGVRHCDGIFAPIRALPHELLLHIFSLVGDTSVLPTADRVTISRVCRHWRAIATSSPDLWSTIDISIPSTLAAELVTPILSVLARCLVLSHPRPLDISVDFYIHRDDIEGKILELLVHHTFRWHSYKHTDVCVGLESFFNRVFPLQLPRLQTLLVEFREEYSLLYAVHLEAPKLQTIKMNIPTTHRDDFSTLPSLTSYSGVFEDDGFGDCSIFLSNALGLSNLHIKHIAQGIGYADPAPLVHNQLHALTIGSCAISPAIQYFSFPNLQELSIPAILATEHCTPCINREDIDSVTIIRDLVHRSQCPLRILNISQIPATLFLPLFRLCALTLTTLRVFFLDSTAEDTLPLIQMLTIPDNATESPVLPHLSDLAFDTSSLYDHLFKLEELETMIRSRWDVKAGVAKLERLRLSSELLPESYTSAYGFKTSSLSIFLRKLANIGLDATWTMQGRDILCD